MSWWIALGLAAWWAAGFFGALHWWRYKHDADTNDLIWFAFMGLFGPLSAFCMWLVCGPPLFARRVWFKRRAPHCEREA